MKEIENRIQDQSAAIKIRKKNWRNSVSTTHATLSAFQGIEDRLELIAELMLEHLDYVETDYLMRGKNGERLRESMAEIEIKKLERKFDTMTEKLWDIQQMLELLIVRSQNNEDTVTKDM